MTGKPFCYQDKRIILSAAVLLVLHLGNFTTFGGFHPVDELVPFDSYFHSESTKTKKERLDRLVDALASHSNDTAYIVSYGTLKDLSCESLENLKEIRRYLVVHRKIIPSRFVLIDGGFRSRGMTNIFMVPKDAVFPEADLKYRLNDLLNKPHR